jgi:hypothetical protein
MTDKTDDLDVMYYQLVLSVQAAAMQHLGKVMSPMTGKVERNLDAARYSIDMLDMLQRKTAGNLTSEEQKLLDHVLHELRLNYLDEAGKGDEPGQSAAGDAGQQPSQDTTEGESESDKAPGESNSNT